MPSWWRRLCRVILARFEGISFVGRMEAWLLLTDHNEDYESLAIPIRLADERFNER